MAFLCMASSASTSASIPSSGARWRAGEGPVELDAGVVQAQFDHREVAGDRLEEIREAQLRQTQFHPVQIVEGLTEVQPEQIALATQERIGGRGRVLHTLKRTRGLGGDGGPLGRSERLPGGQRMRNIWCRTLAPSIVRGAAGRFSATSDINSSVATSPAFVCRA